MRLSFTLALVVLGLGAGAAAAQELPPRDVLNRIVSQLPKPLPPAKITFRPTAGGGADTACRMQNYEMVLAREDSSVGNRYSVLLNPSANGNAPTPKQLLAVITRLAVDADGSERAYHPEDPYGKGVCTRESNARGEPLWRGVCALDTFGPSGIRLFYDDQRARLIDPRRPPKESVVNLADSWREIWPLIRDRVLKAYDLKSVLPSAPDGYNMFYWKEKRLTAFTKRAIIPSTHDGYPCVRGAESRHPGYFVAATTLTKRAPVRPDGCEPTSYIEASEVPFFVLPGGDFGDIEIGDIVIGYLKSAASERVVFGIAGDAGPIEQFGEGSIAFNQALRGKTGEPVMNVDEVNALDIDRDFLREQNAQLAILVLGGTKQRLAGDYSPANIERIGREELARWNGGERLTERLAACVSKTKPAQ